MLIGVVIATFYVFAYSYIYNVNPHFSFDVWLFVIISFPAIVITFISWKWPFVGGLIASGLSVSALLYFLASILIPSLEPSPDYFFLAITICYLLGGALILLSYRFRFLRKGKHHV